MAALGGARVSSQSSPSRVPAFCFTVNPHPSLGRPQLACQDQDLNRTEVRHVGCGSAPAASLQMLLCGPRMGWSSGSSIHPEAAVSSEP